MDGIRNENNVNRLWEATCIDVSNTDEASAEGNTISREKSTTQTIKVLTNCFSIGDNTITD
jgi:hypothetical protein